MPSEAMSAETAETVESLEAYVSGAGGDAAAPFVTAERLIALGIVSNALFWSGLLMPFNAHTLPWVAVLHAYVAMTGLALALGGAVAVVLMAAHQVNTRLFSPQLTAAVMHFSVVIAMGILVAGASLRGWTGAA